MDFELNAPNGYRKYFKDYAGFFQVLNKEAKLL